MIILFIFVNYGFFVQSLPSPLSCFGVSRLLKIILVNLDGNAACKLTYRAINIRLTYYLRTIFLFHCFA